MKNNAKLSLDRVLMDGISDMIFVVRVENESVFIYEFLNQAAMDSRGMTQKVLGKSIREIFPNERGEFLYNHYKEAFASRKPVIYDDSYIASSGKKHHAETKLIPILNDSEVCTHIVATVKDISKERWAETEAKKAWDRLEESNKRYQSLFHHNSDAIFSFDLHGRITNGNAAAESITGYTPFELIGSQLNQLAVKEDLNQAAMLFMQAAGGNTESSQLEIITKAGDLVDVSLKVTPLIIEDEVIGIYGILRDITETEKLLKKYEESEERFQIIAENAHDLITLLNENGEIIYVSPSYKDILGFNHQEYLGKLFLHNVHTDDVTHLNEQVLQSIENGEPFNVQFKQYNHKGEPIWCEANGTPVFDEKHNFKHMVVLTRDIDLQKEYAAKLEYYALHDTLTGLPNRTLFNNKFTVELKNFQERKDGLAVIMIDIDHFKSINDKFGHDIGDGVIEEFGKRVSRALPANGMAARLGGDEFVIILPSIGDKENAEAIAEDILKAVREQWQIKDVVLEVTTSMGIAMAHSKDSTTFSLMKNADLALYEAKNDGRNSYKLRDFVS